jgi:hypothetical protein
VANETVKGMGDLHGVLARTLAEVIESGEATPAHLNVARQFLRDNNIECSGAHNEDVVALTESLPFDETPKEQPVRPN